MPNFQKEKNNNSSSYEKEKKVSILTVSLLNTNGEWEYAGIQDVFAPLQLKIWLTQVVAHAKRYILPLSLWERSTERYC